MQNTMPLDDEPARILILGASHPALDTLRPALDTRKPQPANAEPPVPVAGTAAQRQDPAMQSQDPAEVRVSTQKRYFLFALACSHILLASGVPSTRCRESSSLTAYWSESC